MTIVKSHGLERGPIMRLEMGKLIECNVGLMMGWYTLMWCDEIAKRITVLYSKYIYREKTRTHGKLPDKQWLNMWMLPIG